MFEARINFDRAAGHGQHVGRREFGARSERRRKSMEGACMIQAVGKGMDGVLVVAVAGG